MTNCPEILDVPLMADVLRSLGCAVAVAGDTVTIDVPAELERRGGLPGRCRGCAPRCACSGRWWRAAGARWSPLPGGDAIGSRALDMHQAGLRLLGASSEISHGCVVGARRDAARRPDLARLPERRRHREHPHGRGVRRGPRGDRNAAREPEIVDLVTMLRRMGAKIEGGGRLDARSCTAARRCAPTAHRVIGDRIVGATWGVRRSDGRGDVTVRGVDPHHLELVLDRLGRPARGDRAGRRLPGRPGRASPARWTG